jgi:hypothetical protein
LADAFLPILLAPKLFHTHQGSLTMKRKLLLLSVVLSLGVFACGQTVDSPGYVQQLHPVEDSGRAVQQRVQPRICYPNSSGQGSNRRVTHLAQKWMLLTRRNFWCRSAYCLVRASNRFSPLWTPISMPGTIRLSEPLSSMPLY